MEKTDVRGIGFDNVTKEGALSLLSERLENGKRTVVFTPNSEIMQSCIDDGGFRDIVNSADVVLPDGVGVIKAAKILGTPLLEKVSGVEIGEALFSYLGKNHSFFLFGGRAKEGEGPAVCESAAERMSEKYGCRIAGTRHGYFSKDGAENDETVDIINRSGADVLYVCLGSPVQEKWIFDNKDRLPGVRLILALGGSLDIYAGRQKRAPEIFIKTGTEWLWRLIKQPSRLGRIAALPKFYFGTRIYKIRKNRHERKQTPR